MSDEIHINLGGIKITVSVNALSAALAPYQLCVSDIPAPTPIKPPQTEAERMVSLAERLPGAAWRGSGWHTPDVDPGGFPSLYDERHTVRDFFTDQEFRTILLGVMAKYVGTEVGAYVQCGNDGQHFWSAWVKNGRAPDLLAAYCDCCLAIHARRGSNAK